MNYTNQKQLTYFLYARKSSESEDRQVQSIDDQVDRLKELATNMNLKIKKVYTEAKSAKKPNNRPIFSEMMQRIQNGDADGILCWQINRLSRNPIDTGQLQWMLQKNILKSIQTIDRDYRPEDNVLLFSVESGMANQYILDLSKNVKRGNLRKVKSGWKPGLAAVGYLNELENHTIIPDPDRYDLIRRCWDYMLTGAYTVPQILDKLNNEWGYRSKKRKRVGGNPMSASGLYRIFTNIFYAGVIVYNDKEYDGKHKAMITLQEFDQVQEILGRKGKPRSKKHEFAFTGLVKCGECGASITAEKKKKFIKSTQELKYYTYYHCTRRKKDVECTQRSSVSNTQLEKMLYDAIGSITILPEFFDWALEALNQDNDQEITDRTQIYKMQQEAVNKTQREIDNLTKMRYRELIDDEAFLKEKTELEEKLKKLQKELKITEQRADDWRELTEKAFRFARYARDHFENGGLEERKEILNGLGSNFYLKDKKLEISLHSYFAPIEKHYKKLETEYLRLEPSKLGLNKVKTEALSSVITHWQAWRESNPR